MNIGFYKWSDTDEATKSRLFRRAQADIDDVTAKVRPIIEAVREHGDDALRDYARQFDKADLQSLKVGPEEFEQARKTIDPKLKAALDHCAGNVRKFHEEQMARVEERWMVEIEPGVFAGEQVTPVTSVGLYVPGGKNLFPSSVYMLAIPAVVAKVPQIIILTPPRPDGTISDVILYAAEISGVTDVYKAGGAQAIAAMAYGTQTIPKVHKVLGPCSPFGAAAKQLLGGLINPGMPAGPSEAIVLCDASADPDNTILDVLNEAEHGPDSAGLLITHDKLLADYVHKGLATAIAALPEPQRGYLETNMASYSGVILTDSLDQSIEVCNLYAPEHVVLKVNDPELLVPRLTNAGEIMIGENSPSSLGNYAVGTNHVLPTGGMAHSYSCTSVWDYLKRTSLARVTAEGLNALKPAAVAMADYEGFPAHGNAIRNRKIHND
jgi:histidinol dehydrogenase